MAGRENGLLSLSASSERGEGGSKASGSNDVSEAGGRRSESMSWVMHGIG